MTNDEMVKNRFGKWHRARRLVKAIDAHLAKGGTVALETCTKSFWYTKKHEGMFKATRAGAYVRSGKGWLCIDFTRVAFYE